MGRARTRFFLILGMVLVCATGGLVPFALQHAQANERAAASPHWPTTRGTIAESHVVARGGRSISYEARIWYDYKVGGAAFHRRGIDLDGPNGYFDARGDAQALVDRLPVGSTIDVHYDPEDPGIAVLYPATQEPGANVFRAFMLLAIPMLAAAIACFVAAARSKRRG